MNTHFFDRYSQHIARSIYLVIWFTGMLLGVLSAANHPSVSARALTVSLLKSPSVVACMLLSAARILIFYFALRNRKSVIVYSILFVDAFCFGFCGIAVYFAAGESAWLLRPLFLFSQIWSYIPIWWMLLRSSPSGKKVFLYVAGFNCFIALVDAIFIAPILFDLAKYL